MMWCFKKISLCVMRYIKNFYFLIIEKIEVYEFDIKINCFKFINFFVIKLLYYYCYVYGYLFSYILEFLVE